MCSEMKKIYAFNTIKNKAGNITHRLSPTFILIATPNSISIESPPAEISKIGWTFKPNNRPNAPKISKIAVSVPAFSSPKRFNSLFIFDAVKYAIP